MTLKIAKKFAEPYLDKPGTVTVTNDKGSLAVYVGETIEDMEILCKERNWNLFIIRNSDKTEAKAKTKKNEVQ